MSRGAVVAAEMTDQVRDTIMTSWQRSRQWNVSAGHIDPCYVRDPGLDTPLTRSAGPVLSDLARQLMGQSVSVILTDPSGLVLSRLTGDGDLERHLDRCIRLADDGDLLLEAVLAAGGGRAHVSCPENSREPWRVRRASMTRSGLRRR